MNKRILLLYFTREQKAELVCCEKILKALFRKFRTSVAFDYLQLDTSLNCRRLMSSQLSEKISQSGAFLLCSRRPLLPEEATFFGQSVGMYATQYQNSGISIFFPFEGKSFCADDDIIKETVSYDIGKVRKCIRVCADYAKEKEKAAFICTQDYGADQCLFKEFERIASEHRYVDFRHMSCSEIVWNSARYITQPCVVFGNRNIADIVLMHTFAAQSMPGGYTLHHTDCGRIYENLSSPFSYEDCHKVRLTLLAFSALIENEFKMKNAAFWLRQSISTVFSKFECRRKEELTDKIISAINEPMRKKSI